MIAKKHWLVSLSLLLLMLVLVSCAGSPPEVATEDSGFLLALPRLTVDVGADGSLRPFGQDPQTIKTLTLGRVDLTEAKLPQNYVDWFTQAGVQHIELMHRDDGMYLFVNGKAMPHIAWSKDSLALLSSLLERTGIVSDSQARLLTIVVPFLQRMGLDLVLRFPVQEGAEAIPLREVNAPIEAAATAEDSSTLAVIKTQVNYDDQGIPQVLSVSTRELEQALGINLRGLELPPQTIRRMMASDVQHIVVRTTPDGLKIFVNGELMPYLAWSDTLLNNGAGLYGQLFFPEDYAQIREFVNLLLPMLDNIDASVGVTFPVSEGTEPIPLPTE